MPFVTVVVVVVVETSFVLVQAGKSVGFALQTAGLLGTIVGSGALLLLSPLLASAFRTDMILARLEDTIFFADTDWLFAAVQAPLLLAGALLFAHAILGVFLIIAIHKGLIARLGLLLEFYRV